MPRLLLDKLERRFSRYAIHNLTAYLLVGQGIMLFGAIAQPAMFEKLLLIPAKVLDGEVWRIITFAVAMAPPGSFIGMVFLFFYFYLFYLMGRALEEHWGAFRYNVYIFLGLILTFAAAWLTPTQPTTSIIVYTTIFLAFAYLYPDFTILLFFILPVKIKWLALITWLLYAVSFLQSDTWSARIAILAGVTNYLVFFGPQIVTRMVRAERRRAQDADTRREAAQPFHVCSVCGVTDKIDPDRQFRYDKRGDETVCICESCMEQQQH
jgi:hypothetical protein